MFNAPKFRLNGDGAESCGSLDGEDIGAPLVFEVNESSVGVIKPLAGNLVSFDR